MTKPEYTMRRANYMFCAIGKVKLELPCNSEFHARLFFRQKYQRCIHRPVKHLRWNFLQKELAIFVKASS